MYVLGNLHHSINRPHLLIYTVKLEMFANINVCEIAILRYFKIKFAIPALNKSKISIIP